MTTTTSEPVQHGHDPHEIYRLLREHQIGPAASRAMIEQARIAGKSDMARGVFVHRLTTDRYEIRRPL